VRYLRQIVWHVFPSFTVFLLLVGVQLFGVAVISTVFIIDNAFEINSIWEPIGLILTIVFQALVPCLVLFPTAVVLDRLTRNGPVWLRIVLPFPFILASAFLVYVYFHTQLSEDTYGKWLSLIEQVATLLLVLLVTFSPYWYILQVQRLLMWLFNKSRIAMISSRRTK
jgi:hypothetical protein